MSLLKKPELNTRWKKLLLVAVSLLLVVPCVAAAAFALRFEVDPSPEAFVAQDQESKEKVKERLKEKVKPRDPREMEEIKERMESDPRLREEMERRGRIEMEMHEARQAALVRLAKINMDQAIQIATSQNPGKVLICSLDAKGWEEPGKLGKDGIVFYHVIIADEVNPGETYVWVNAIDGSIIKTEKALPRRARTPEGN